MDQETLICPCCSQERNIARETPLPQITAHNPQPGPSGFRTAFELWWDEQPGRLVQIAWEGKLQWACWPCLESGAALMADPRRQQFCNYPPYLAYFDRTCRCTDCSRDFIFSAAEQQYWYETLRFLVQSVPRQCLACRRARREKAHLDRELQAALAHLQPHNVEQLLHVADLYRRRGSRPRAAEYLHRARKHAHTSEQQAALSAAEATLKEQD